MPPSAGLPRRLALAAAPALLLARPALAAWPDRPLRLVVGFPAGSATDVLARSFSEPFGRELGQPVVIENRAGGNGTVATDYALRTPADGQTLLVYSTSAGSVNPHIQRRLPYDPIRDVTPIGYVAEMPYILVVGPENPAQDLPGFLDFLRARGGETTFSCPNAASLIAASLLARMTGTQMQPIPYRGGQEALTEVMAGRVDATFTDLGSGLAQARAGRVRVLGVTTLRPFPLVPEVPPLATAVPGYDLTVWYGLVGPAGLPAGIVATAAAALNRALDEPAVVDRFSRQGFVPRHMAPAAFAAFLPEQLALWGERVRLAGIQAE